ncbi:MAG TPA: hypothetical protein VJC04_03155 [Candidatus Paceibacterota bacterium]
MNKDILPKISIIVLAIVFFSVALIAEATVGGPTFVDSFKYNPADESVYYIQTSTSGRGCPPGLMKISLNSGIVNAVFSCNDAESLMGLGNDFSVVDAEIARMTTGFKDLTPINLVKNNIFVDVVFVRTEKLSQTDYTMRNHYITKVFQNNNKIGEFQITGCNLEQPFIFGGYTIPSFNKKIILLLSTKGDCFEGGYILERLLVLEGVDRLDKTYSSDLLKTRSALAPSESTLVIFEKDKVIVEEKKESETPNVIGGGTTNSATNSVDTKNYSGSYSTLLLIAIIIVSILAGTVFGGLIFKPKM